MLCFAPDTVQPGCQHDFLEETLQTVGQREAELNVAVVEPQANLMRTAQQSRDPLMQEL